MVKFHNNSLEVFLMADSVEEKNQYLNALISAVRWYSYFSEEGSHAESLRTINMLQSLIIHSDANPKTGKLPFLIETNDAGIMQQRLKIALLHALGWVKHAPEMQPDDKDAVFYLSLILEEVLEVQECCFAFRL